jgi:outer membrane receptor protein involved in Fe transport
MKKYLLTIAATLLLALSGAFAQPGGGNRMAAMKIGRIYGKIVDETGSGVGYATVQLMGKTFDRATRTLKDTLYAGQLTEDNGDFNIEELPIMGEYTLIVSFLGYAELQQKVDFGIPFPQMGGRPGGGQRDSTQAASGRPAGPPAGGRRPGGFPGAGGAGNFTKDLGNIELAASAAVLEEVTVTAEASIAKLSLDRKTYRVDKDLTTAGGTAQDALRNVPSLSVDLNGNVSLRNGSPQILVDGRQTNLSLDQISADAIESVEVITNPSAKYDAGGGTAGIVNIVLKKDKRIGYNGSVRAGADSYGGFNFGGDINARGEKINLFGSSFLNSRAGVGEGETLRENFFGNPPSNITQLSDSENDGLFAVARGGMDYFLDNRNTLTMSGSYVRGNFGSVDDLRTTTDFLFPEGTVSESYLRTADGNRGFRNIGASILFKHLFPQKGAEWTADINYNRVRFESDNSFQTVFDGTGATTREQQDILGEGSFLTLQSDFIKPLDEQSKLEGGVRATLRTNENNTDNLLFDANRGEFVEVPQFADEFSLNDNVYAAYLQASRQNDKWGVQAGLRAESSFFTGTLPAQDSSFNIDYPISLFPSVFVTRQLGDGDQIQLAYTRRINRPNFFQTLPFTDFSDSLDLRRGEPGLLPEFTNSLELSYQNMFKSGANLLISLYYKQATDLITSYQFTEFNEQLGREVVITSFTNGNQAAAYGAEFTLRNTLLGWLELTSNLNIFGAEIEADNIATSISPNRLNAFLKETVQVDLPKGYALQFNGEYRTRASFVPSTGGNSWRGGGGQSTPQGYTKAVWFVDASLRKNFLDNKASLTLSIQDIFASRRFGSVSATEFFTQDSFRLRNPQQVRLNFSYRFGKMDVSLFSRRNNNQSSQGGDMMGG